MTNTVELWGVGALGAGVALVAYAAARLRARRAAHRLSRREGDSRTVAGILIADDWRERLATRARIVGVDQLRGEVKEIELRARFGHVEESHTACLRADAWLDELEIYPCDTMDGSDDPAQR